MPKKMHFDMNYRGPGSFAGHDGIVATFDAQVAGREYREAVKVFAADEHGMLAAQELLRKLGASS